jgi:hypothetical protein
MHFRWRVKSVRCSIQIDRIAGWALSRQAPDQGVICLPEPTVDAVVAVFATVHPRRALLAPYPVGQRPHQLPLPLLSLTEHPSYPLRSCASDGGSSAISCGTVTASR